MLRRIALCLSLTFSVSASHAQAESLGEALNLSIGPKGAAALSDMPAEFLAALHGASSLLAANAQGLVSDRTAALLLAEFSEELSAAQPRLDELDADRFRIAMILQSRVVVSGARELVRTLPEGFERDALLEAVAELGKVVANSVGLRLHAGADGPDNTCFQEYGACMVHCSDGAGFMGRALCGMDCNLDLAACLGSAGGNGIGGLIRVVGGLVPEPGAGPGR